ncbi:hypothetical protein BGZ58_008330 [Dissophora ornata]|nr:hypothetical protein BGZ58_008330 [Dissophora ornata]
MSVPPSEQPAYYAPAPIPGSVGPEGTPTYQYVTPQQPGTPAYQYQPSPDQAQQPYYAAQSPAPQQAYPQSPVVQQQYTQAPIPIEQQYAQPVPVQQQAYFAQDQAQPATIVYTQQQTTTEMPVVTGNGQGLTGKMPQVENCCLCFPLHTGAMIIAILMFIFYGYCGLILFLDGSYYGGYATISIILGILYIVVAVVSAYGFVGIYKEEPMWVDRFIRMFVIGSIAWAVLYVVQIIITAVNYSNYSYYYDIGLNWAAIIIEFLISAFFQFYFCVCLVSYQRILHARVGDSEKQIPMQITV